MSKLTPSPQFGSRLSVWMVGLAVSITVVFLSAEEPAQPVPVHFPTVPAEHSHARTLLENAVAFFAADNKMIDPASGYPFEGWNHDPEKGLFLRSFTQLTAIALWMELLGNVVAGYADTPYLSRDRAWTHLNRLVKSLRQDQRDPCLSADGLLSNFLDLSNAKRCGPLITEIDKSRFLDALGTEKGRTVWKALQSKGWIVPRPNDHSATVHRGPRYGAAFFDEALTPFADPATKEAIMAILDQRVVLTVFGDNANLSLSAAITIGALSLPQVKDQPVAAAIRRELERFLEDQKPGYTRLYDSEAGLFYFGRDVTRDRLFGWEDLQGKWKTGHMDYLVNEFRGPATFVMLRYGLPVDAVANLGFKIKPYRTPDGRDVYTLAPWDGSAFQVLGLNLSLGELHSPSWRRLLENAVAIEINFSTHKKLPGFLSESYTGFGARYTGEVGIPDISVTPKPRITDSASLYTLGTAFNISPHQVEKFLAANWPVVSELRTDHGPWEGFNVTRQEVIRFQTSAHTLALILGMLGTGSDHLQRYLDSHDLGGALANLFKPGENVDMLAEPAQDFAWSDPESTLQSSRRAGTFHIQSDRIKQFGIALVPNRKEGVDLSGGLLRIRYQAAQPLDPVVIALKPVKPANPDAGIIATEVFSRLANTAGREEEITIPLPATPGLRTIKEVVLTGGPGNKTVPVDLRLTHFSVAQLGP